MTTRITVKNEVGREVNPYIIHGHIRLAHASFEKRVKSYPMPGIPDTKDGEFVEAELINQRCDNVEDTWPDGSYTRQIYRIPQQPNK